jgi:hypothetical protein
MPETPAAEGLRGTTLMTSHSKIKSCGAAVIEFSSNEHESNKNNFRAGRLGMRMSLHSARYLPQPKQRKLHVDS